MAVIPANAGADTLISMAVIPANAGADTLISMAVIPANAGIQLLMAQAKGWIPAFAGMTSNKAGMKNQHAA